MAETRGFRMDPKLLSDVIKRQAGSLEKAILEGVMNAVDAGATKCSVFVRDRFVEIADDGRGFRSKAEVTEFFEVFGKPHDAAEGKVYGTFRMGRGQMFAFGKNIWRTGKFRMEVDIETKGLDYDLHAEKQKHDGCTISIDLYAPIMPSDIARVEESLELWIRYCPIPVTIDTNDKGPRQITTPVEEEKWPLSTDDAHIRLQPQGTLKVYNLGVLVIEYAQWKYGTGGTVVSKNQLKVNFARNDIQSDCAVWNRIKAVVDRKATETNQKSKTLTDDQRRRMIQQLRAGELSYNDVKSRPLVKLCTGKCVSLQEFCTDDHSKPISVCRTADRIGDALTRRGMAVVLSTEALEWFRCMEVKDLVHTVRDWKRNNGGYVSTNLPRIEKFEVLARSLSSVHTLEKVQDATANEQLWMALIRKAAGFFGWEFRRIQEYHHETSDNRRIELGSSEVYLGWTDGKSYVAISKRFLAGQAFTIEGFCNVGHLLCHEWCHHTPDMEDHDHDQAFYELYHDKSHVIGKFAEHCLRNLPAILDAHDRKMTKSMLRQQDVIAKAKQKGHDLVPVAASE